MKYKIKNTTNYNYALGYMHGIADNSHEGFPLNDCIEFAQYYDRKKYLGDDHAIQQLFMYWLEIPTEESC